MELWERRKYSLMIGFWKQTRFFPWDCAASTSPSPDPPNLVMPRSGPSPHGLPLLELLQL